MEDQLPAGFEVPIHRSLTEPILLAGVQREIAILNGTFAAAFIIGLHLWYSAPIFVVIHLIAVYATKKDPLFFEAFVRQIKLKSYYDA